jgi:hypothetical protein
MVSRFALTALVVFSLVPSAVRGQDAKSADLAKQLAQLLDQKKLDAIALPDAQIPGNFVAALYIPGTQLLVVSGKYTAPALMTDLLTKKDYRGAYSELVSAAVPDSKLFVMDTYADGLVLRPSGSNAPDTVGAGTKSTTFDGDWKKAKISEADYAKAFSENDAAYSRALQSLIAHLKTSGT